jgi:cell fate regulator YaaT (PSP1 superfamily)
VVNLELFANVYGVSFLPVGKIIYYSEIEEEIKKGDLVLAMTEFGLDVGKVEYELHERRIDDIGYEVKPLVRKLTDADLKIHEENLKDSKIAFWKCKDYIKHYNLSMKLLYSKYMFDRSRLLFYFSAEGRVDFRELVKDLAREFKTRIELRQVGVRDEVKFLGGIGLCGLPTCCSVFLRDFDSVTLKDAKKQQLLINPVKISGQCRRLLCCLRYEKPVYDELTENIPEQDEVFEYEGKTCKVINVNIFTEKVTAISDEGTMIVLPFDYFRTSSPE